MTDMPPPNYPPDNPPPPVQPAASDPKTPSAMVWALILSLFGLFIIPLLASVALVIAGWKKAGASRKGRGLGVAALVVNGLWTLLLVVGGFSGGNSMQESTAEAPLDTPVDSSSGGESNDPLQGILLSPEVRVSNSHCALAAKAIRQASNKAEKRLAESKGKASNPRAANRFAQNNPWVKKSNLNAEIVQGIAEFSNESLVEVTGDPDAASQVDAEIYRRVFLTECELAQDYESAQAITAQADNRGSSIAQMAKSAPWYPEGFSEYDSNIAWRYGGGCDADFGYCWAVEVVSLTGCPRMLYVEVSIEQGGANIGYSNDLTSGVAPKQIARMELTDFGGSGTKSARLTEINCY